MKESVRKLISQFREECGPLETNDCLLELVDEKTGATYSECHLRGSAIIKFGTTTVALDPETQPEYKANRDVVVDDKAFLKMQEDAKLRRSFSNIVAEWKPTTNDLSDALQIIGGQHRFEAIKVALEDGVDVQHGVKVYFDLNKDQRHDVQTISNTNIEVSNDLIDRLSETAKGADLRNWCQAAGLLKAGQDFADNYRRGGPISVRLARTFITNYFLGTAIDSRQFDKVATTPISYKAKGADTIWERTKKDNPKLWENKGLIRAGKEFSLLIESQRVWFVRLKAQANIKSSRRTGKQQRTKPDYPEKALNIAIVAAWAFVAGVLHSNEERLVRHFSLKTATNHDPLHAEALATGRHTPTDPDNYRGLGSRTDPQERARFAELFFMQAEDGKGITKSWVDSAISSTTLNREFSMPN